MTSMPDDLAEAARDLALAALHEITPASTVGPAAGHIAEESGAVSLLFENRLPGYPGWFWTVTVAQVENAEPTVLEVELMPSEGALLAPDWVPWAERLAEYRAHQAELAAQLKADAEHGDAEDAGDDDSDDHDDSDGDDDSDDHDDSDDDDDSDDVSPRLHAGDLDGVDIDELDDNGSDDEGEESDEDESDGDESDDDDDESDDESE